MLTIGSSVDALSILSKTVAFQSSPSGFVSLISFVNILYALMVDTLIFEEKIDLKEVLAAGVIFLVTVILAI